MSSSGNNEMAFAVAALQEIPDQFKEIRALHLLWDDVDSQLVWQSVSQARNIFIINNW